MKDHQPLTLMSAKLTLAGARAIADAALTHADTIGMDAITVAIVDEGGHLLFLARNKPPYPTIEISTAKARTSASFGISSAQFGEHTQSGNPMTRADLTTFVNDRAKACSFRAANIDDTPLSKGDAHDRTHPEAAVLAIAY